MCDLKYLNMNCFAFTEHMLMCTHSENGIQIMTFILSTLLCILHIEISNPLCETQIHNFHKM